MKLCGYIISLTSIYFFIAFVISCFYGYFGPLVFPEEKKNNGLTWFQKIRKFIIYFFGAAVGFLVLYYLIKKGKYCIFKSEYSLFNIIDVLLLIIALMGISGFIAPLTYRIFKKIEEFIIILLKGLDK